MTKEETRRISYCSLNKFDLLYGNLPWRERKRTAKRAGLYKVPKGFLFLRYEYWARGKEDL